MIRINLLPRIPRRRLPSRRLFEFGVPLVTLAVVVVLGVTLANQIGQMQRQLADTQRQIDEIQPTVARVQQLDRQIAALREKERVITDLIGLQLPAAAVLNEIRLLVPTEVWLISMGVPGPTAINLEGFAMTYYAVAQLMDNLATGQLFRLVDLSVVQLDRVGLREIVKFSVTARIAKPQAAGGVRQ